MRRGVWPLACARAAWCAALPGGRRRPLPHACSPAAAAPRWLARRQWQVYRRALPGLNSAAVGLIVASVFQLTLQAWSTSPFPTTSICIGMLVFGATEVLGCPAPLAVIGGGVIGVIGWAADMV